MSIELLVKYRELEAYVAWDEADATRVAEAAQVLLPHLDELVSDFYAEIGRRPPLIRVIEKAGATVEGLQATLRHWISQLLTGPYDRDYLLTRLGVGRRHVLIGLDQSFANAALSRMRTSMVGVLHREWQGEREPLLEVVASLHKRIDLDAMLIQDAYQTEYLTAQLKLAKENQQLKAVLQRQSHPWEIVGQSKAIQEVFRLIERAGPTDKPILIQGESGVGKELVAKALHRASDRSEMPLVTINCAALPETLLESELFGHEKGAFTSAVAAKPGLFEVADGGTLFIDEIGELAGPLQAKLLRVLEDGMLRRLGSVKEHKVDVRILAASNRDLAKEVAAKRFREDLYYRINVLSLHVPPLRERTEDIPLLAEHFAEGEWQFDDEMLATLTRYSWPGNVRQLQNALERAKILADDDLLCASNLPPEIVRACQAPAEQSNSTDLDSINRQHIIDTLARLDGNKARTARALGVSRRTLYRLLEKHSIDPS